MSKFCLDILTVFVAVAVGVGSIFGQSADRIYGCGSNQVISYAYPFDCVHDSFFQGPLPYTYIDMAFDLGGQMFLLGSQRVYKADLSTQSFEFCPPIGNFGFGAMVTDRYGRILIAGEDKFGWVNNADCIFYEIGEFFPTTHARGDMTWYKGRLLMTSRTRPPLPQTNVLIEVNPLDPASSVILADLSFPGVALGGPDGMITIMDRCDNQRVFILGAFVNGATVYELNMDDYTTTPVCLGTVFPAGAAMLREYVTASCDLMLKLDWDNSSGAIGFGWIDTIQCKPYPHPVCDEDVYVYAEGRIDSMYVWLEVAPDGADEILAFPGYPGIQFTIENGNRILLINEGDIDFSDWETALRAIRYAHLGSSPVAGWRSIAFLPFSTIRSADTVRADLYLTGSWPEAGRDSTIYRCRDEGVIALSELLSPEAMAGGAFSPGDAWWQPAFAPYTSRVLYVVTHPECPADSAWLTLIAMTIPMENLGPDRSLCYGDSLLVALSGNYSYRWQDGSNEDIFMITEPGQYVVTVTDMNGCSSSTDIKVDFSNPPEEVYEGIVLLCPGDPWSWHGELIEGAGTFMHVLISSAGCDSILFTLDVQYDNQPLASWSGDTVLCEGGSGKLHITAGYSYQWSHGPSTADVTIQEPGTYTVTVSDNVSVCARVMSIDVLAAVPIILPEVQVVGPHCPEDTFGVITIGQAIGGVPPLQMRLAGQPVAENTIIGGYRPGTYILKVEDVLGCSKSRTLDIPASPSGSLDLPLELQLEMGEEGFLVVSGDLPAPVEYTWDPPSWVLWQDGNRFGIQAEESGIITLIVSDGNGCNHEASIRLIIKENVAIYFPSAFSPNGDGINDSWLPRVAAHKAHRLARLQVFDRWGNLLYTGSGRIGETGWDGRSLGRVCDPGLYAYMLTLIAPEGGGRVYSGEIQLLR